MAAIATLALFTFLEEAKRSTTISKRKIYDREDAFDLPEHKFITYFRLDKAAAIMVIDNIKDCLRSSRYPPHLRVLVALRFYATGSYQNLIGNDIYLGVSQMTVSRCINDVSKAIVRKLMNTYVHFPNREEQKSLKQRFFAACGLPGVIGAIDCTHVAIIQPVENSMCYMNRKGYYSINVQLIVDDRLQIRAVNARYPGSVHDAFIWRHSCARHVLSIQSRNNPNAWLLGDSGYPLEPWLLTPVMNPSCSAEETFNDNHISGRICVERCNGVLKARFRCLLKHRVLHYSPTEASWIINACCILHNICNDSNLPFDACVEEKEQDICTKDDIDVISATNSSSKILSEGRKIRQKLVNML